MLADPGRDELIVPGMARIAPRSSFGKNLRELRLQREDVRNRWGRWRHVVGLIFFELAEIEIIAARIDLRRAEQGTLTRGEERQSRRKGERLLRPGEEDINPELIHRNRHGAEGRNRVEDEQRLREF